MNTARGARVALAALAALAVDARAQTGDAERYSPLFTPKMIEKASPEQAERMRAAEKENRRAFDQRQEVRRRQEEEAREREERARAPLPPPPPKRKIYKWVDKNGRVHFGDAPQGEDAEVVDVGGAAKLRGSAAPPPSKQD